MKRRILVPLDGSNNAEIVIPYVEEIGAKLSAEITLAIVSESRNTDTVKRYEAYLKRIEEQVQFRVKDLGGKEPFKVLSTILFGNPASEIMRHAKEINAGLIVIASRGSSGNEPGVLGSTATKVVRASSMPVLLVKVPGNDAGRQAMRLVKKILLPLDRSHAGEAAIPFVEELAQGLGAELVFLHIVEPPVQTLTDQVGGPTDGYALKRESTAIRAYLANIEKDLKAKGLSVSSVTDTGAPADVIIDYAQGKAIDLIAMSTHGRSGIGRWLLGSVTDKVLQAGDTPVLIVRATKT